MESAERGPADEDRSGSCGSAGGDGTELERAERGVFPARPQGGSDPGALPAILRRAGRSGAPHGETWAVGLSGADGILSFCGGAGTLRIEPEDVSGAGGAGNRAVLTGVEYRGGGGTRPAARGHGASTVPGDAAAQIPVLLSYGSKARR